MGPTGDEVPGGPGAPHSQCSGGGGRARDGYGADEKNASFHRAPSRAGS